MDESILLTIRKLLGDSAAYDDPEDFDQDLIVHINTVLAILSSELGIGPVGGYIVIDANDKWSDFLTNPEILCMVKSYVYGKVKLLFDPPDSAAQLESLKNLVNELEWRLPVAADTL